MTSSVLPDYIPRSLEDFEDLVLEVVSEWIVGGIIEMIGTIGEYLYLISDLFIWTVRDAGLAVLGPFQSISSSVFAAISALDQLLASLAASAGPLSPIIVAMTFGGALIVGFIAVRSILEVIKWI